MRAHKRIAKLALAALLLAGTAGCTAGRETEEEREQNVSAHPTSYTQKDVDPALARSMNAFALNFYGMLDREPGEESTGPNRMVSPAGIAIALSMLKAGARGDSDRELDKVLKLNGLSGEALDSAQLVMREMLRGYDPSIRMDIANSIWSREGFALKPDYVNTLQKDYGARAEALDFDSARAAETMNAWAAENTAGKIEQVIAAPIDPDAVLFLMNAMYFKGSWTQPFEAEQTQDLPFTTAAGEETTVPTMAQQGEYDYLDAEGFQAIRLPYGESGNFGMVLALPDEDSSLDAFKRKYLPRFGKWSKQLDDAQGRVELPKFKLEDSLKLNDALIALGMPSVFDASKAELEGIGEARAGRLYVSKVGHDTFIEVNEEGTEAVAVTSITVEDGAAPGGRPFELRLNRPFFFAITDKTTDLIVFMGEVGSPAEK
ncbi:serpin family protein [Saccharibacillus sp. CPCC 101409]|uniref:serpin family protein n=1 Tax=Saccharibacillus sp. CPCC 101409 TaxID=3058041 RepID=UPI0026711E95|nr:serpin family protein [Saccharibacillus sp. CPCC 101409]MDO3409484.1 serpin family protein [Saccharibacillus sp. CPCC 101409]